MIANRQTVLEEDGPAAIAQLCASSIALKRELHEAVPTPGNIHVIQIHPFVPVFRSSYDARIPPEQVERSALLSVVEQNENRERQQKQRKKQTRHLGNAYYIRKTYDAIVFDTEGVQTPVNSAGLSR